MKVFENLIKLTSLLLIANTIVGCSKSTDEDKVGDTQFCLDDVPITGLSTTQRSSEINTCLAKMDGVTSRRANLIRCASGFMIEGLADPTKIIEIGDKLSNTNGQDPTTALMGILVFKSQGASETVPDAEDKAFAQKTFNYCNSTGSSGYLMISSIANMATVIASIAGGDITAGITNLVNNPSELANASAEVIGATATAAYQTSCANNSDSNTEICTQLGAAINSSGGDMTAIGNSLLATWNASNPTP